jgi:outer membrane protein assembly factor BamB
MFKLNRFCMKSFVFLSAWVLNLATLIVVLPTSLAQETALPQPTSRERTEVYPLDGVVLADNSVLVVDRNLPGIWKRSDEQLSIFVQGSPSFRKPMNACRCIATSPDGRVFVGDSATREVYEVMPDGTTKPLAGGRIGVAMDIAISSDGVIYVADLERRAIWKWNLIDGKPEPLFPKANARGIAVDSKNRLWVLSQNKEQLVRYETDGTATTLVSERFFEFAHNIIVDDDDTAWVSDGYAKAIWKVAPGAAPVKAIQSELFQNPVGLFKHGDKIAVVDPHAMAVFHASRDGTVELWFKITK